MAIVSTGNEKEEARGMWKTMISKAHRQVQEEAEDFYTTQCPVK